MPTQTVTISPSSAKSLGLITMDRSHSKTDTSLTAPFNQTATLQTSNGPTSVKSLSLVVMDKVQSKTDTSLSSSFNTTFNLQITTILSLALARSLESLDSHPIIISSRTGVKPAIILSRADVSKPAIVHSHGPFIIISRTNTSLSADWNQLRTLFRPEVSAVGLRSIVSMDKTQNKTDSSLSASFDTSVA